MFRITNPYNTVCWDCNYSLAHDRWFPTTSQKFLYPARRGNTKARRKAEQEGIDKTAKEQGKKPNQKNKDVLDNKRNEISDKNRPKYGL